MPTTWTETSISAATPFQHGTPNPRALNTDYLFGAFPITGPEFLEHVPASWTEGTVSAPSYTEQTMSATTWTKATG